MHPKEQDGATMDIVHSSEMLSQPWTNNNRICLAQQCFERGYPQKMDIHVTTMNNDAYYIALIEGLRTTRMYKSNGISVYTDSELVCRKMKVIYQVRKTDLKLLHVEPKTIAGEFQFFTTSHH